MESHEVLKKTIDNVGVKQVAADMHVSTPLVYKWCQADEADASGTRNPLDRLLALCNTTNSTLPLIWLCDQLNGSFVKNPEVEEGKSSTDYITRTQQLLQEFSELLQTISNSIANDGLIDPQEAQSIHRAWLELKMNGEEFVNACEQGLFDKSEK